MKLAEIDKYLEDKIDRNPNYIVFTFYELRVKLNLSSDETLNFLHLVRTKLENNNYKIFTTGQNYVYEGNNKRVNENELLIAIKKG